MPSDTLITGRRRIRSLMVAVTVAVSVSSCGDGTGSTATAVSVTAADSSAATSVAGPSVTTGSTAPTAVSPTTTVATTIRSSTTKATERPTIHDLERDLEDSINDDGTYPGRATCEGTGALSDWQTVMCVYSPDEPAEFGPIHVAIFDHNRYAWTVSGCCAGSPSADEYPSGLLCRDLLEPPPDLAPDFYQPDSNNLSYGLAVFYWVREGRPERMDADHNGVPCETVYPKGEVDEYWASVRVLP